MAACVRIVQAHQGIQASEASIRRSLDPASLRTAALVFDWTFQSLQFDRAEDRELLLSYLARGAFLIVDVYPGHLTMLSERLGLTSRHGPLMPRSPEDRGRLEDLTQRVPQYPHHAIVVVGLREETVQYLDPWFPTGGQPLAMIFEDFFTMWTGQVVIPRAPRGRRS